MQRRRPTAAAAVSPSDGDVGRIGGETTRRRDSNSETHRSRWRRLGYFVAVAVLCCVATKLRGHSSNTYLRPAAANADSLPPGRFPPYGTDDFSERCGWALAGAAEARAASSPAKERPCTFYYGPSKGENEGISWWAGQLVSSHLLALQAGCEMVYNYGPTVDIRQVLLDLPGASRASANWTSHRCQEDADCFEIPPSQGAWEVRKLGKSLTFEIPDRSGKGEPRRLAPVPRYRYSYSRKKTRFKKSDDLARNLAELLPGFDLESGMACSLGVLFRLAPAASEFQPGLFTTILPTLYEKESLVLGLHIRTLWADMSRNNANLTASPESLERFRADAKVDIEYALNVEGDYLTGRTDPDRDFSSIVWMLATDSPQIKQWIFDTYSGKDANADVRQGGKKKYPSRRIPRTVLTTGSMGRHSVFKDQPSTEIFAETFLDWFLLGESDLVLSNRYSFADTAALRTARPLYKKGSLHPLLG